MTSKPPPGPLPAERLRNRCDPEMFRFETTDDLATTQNIIGQDRAVRAIRMGLDIPSPGFNIFIAGHAGTGRNTTIDRFLAEIPRDGPAPPDLAYVNNFKEPGEPRLLTFAAGQGSRFRDAIHSFVTRLRKILPAVFDSDEYLHERKAVLEGYRVQQRSILKGFEEQVEGEGFRLVQLQMGPIVRPSLVPLIDGEPTVMDRLEEAVEARKISGAERQRFEKRFEELNEKMEDALKRVREIDREAQARAERLDIDLLRPLVHDPLAELRAEHQNEAVGTYLEELEESLLANSGRLRRRQEPGEPAADSSEPPTDDPLIEFRVNLIVDNGKTRGAPVVNESSPTHRNLFGAIERFQDRGEWRSNYTQVRAGSYVRASGGYLVLNASDVLSEPGVWITLKRTLRTGLCEIQSYDPVFMFTTSVLKPQPIPCQVKVVLVGGHDVYRLLYGLDPEFSKIFKVKAEFDTVMKATPEGTLEYAGFIRKIVDLEKLAPFDRSGVAGIVEFGMRQAGRGDRLSTKFTEIADVLREASWRATQQGAARVSAAHVREAVEGRCQRVSLAQTKMYEAVEEGTLLLDVTGAKIGQVNALAYYDLGDHAFGVPARITASLGMGRAGIVNIEREADMSGPTHSKGVLILAGYLRNVFAQDKPLTLSASLCFEQSYGGIDGDSASSAEVYALLSALAGAPLRQSFAITGSVNQMGEVQPIGGVNDKIEGWFAACKARGMTGEQGVLIPVQNVKDLMLDTEIVEAARRGRFAIYPVAHVTEGIELLTGIPAGERGAEGRFPEGTVYARADQRLREMAENFRFFNTPGPGAE